MEEEEEEESNSLSHKNNTKNDSKLIDYSIDNRKYSNIKLLNEYLETLHHKVLPKCQ